jgi:hypothetical protein
MFRLLQKMPPQRFICSIGSVDALHDQRHQSLRPVAGTPITSDFDEAKRPRYREDNTSSNEPPSGELCIHFGHLTRKRAKDVGQPFFTHRAGRNTKFADLRTY